MRRYGYVSGETKMRFMRDSLSSAFVAVSLIGAGTCLAVPALASDKVSGEAAHAIDAIQADKALTDFAKAWMVAALARDAEFIAANSIAVPKSSFLVFGTGGAAGMGFDPFVEHLKELKPLAWSELNPEGYVLGDFAWFFGNAKATVPDGDQATARMTLVMRRVGASWKVVHCHLSEPVHRSGIQKD